MTTILPTKAKQWLTNVEEDINDKDSMQIMQLLLKRFFKQRLDFETLITSAEELLPSDKIKILMDQLIDLCQEEQDDAESSREQEAEGSEVEGEPLPLPVVDNDCDDRKLVTNNKKRRKTNASDAVKSGSGTITPPEDVQTQEPQTLANNIEQTFDNLISYSSPKDADKDKGFYPPSPKDQQSPLILDQELTSPNSLKGKKRDCSKQVFSQYLQYIVRSLERYSDPSLESDEHKDECIAELQDIAEQVEQGNYSDLHSFNADITEMLNTLEQKGKSVEKVRKHFVYLVDYYFPSHGTKGKLRSSKK